MKMTLAIIAAGVMMAVQPAWAQTTSSKSIQSAQQTPSHTDGTSGVGVRGKPGGKSGAAVRPPEGNPAGADVSGVKGLPGNKSGPAAKPEAANPDQNKPGYAQTPDRSGEPK